MKRILAALTAVFTLTSGLTVFAAEPDAPQEPILPPLPSITVDMEGDKKPISPYIYGVNDNYANENYDLVSPKSLRQGGNRTTGYNWETNYSNAGADWEHYNDDYMNMNLPEDIKFLPGAPALNVANIAKERNIGYKATTLQMAGYVAADMGIEGRNPVLEEEAAPSPRWKEVVARKGSDFVLDPDKDDDYVYMDEYVNYLVETLGDSQNGGFNGYLLDNDPALWSETHPRIHPEKTGAKELVDKGIELAGAVKDVDPNAEIIGPVLFGFGAYSNLAEAPDWEDVKGEHEWYVSYYLDQMAQAEEEAGRRLLDVFDVHYYSEAYTGLELNENNQYQTTGHRVSNCPLEDCEECAAERLQIVRTLWDSTYVNNFDEIPNVWDGAVHRGEKSWVNQWLFGFLPVLPRIQSDIEKYYPGTKLGITEYNFGGGNNISGAIAQADALGVFGQQGVYLANLWALTNTVEELDYQFSAINLFTNYDGEGSSFGDISVPAITTEVEKFTAYAAADSEDDSRVTVVASNKTDVPQTVQLRLQNSGYNTASYGIYSIAEGSSEIISGDVPAIVSVPESIIVHLPAMSVSQVEIKLGGQVEILPVLGDVNTDGYVTVADIVMLAEFLLDSELVTLTEEAFTAADIDCNGTLNVKDLMYIVLHVSGRIEKLEDIAPDPQDVETERKFLVLAEDLPLEAMEAGSKYELTQTYISYDPEERVRKVEYDSGTVGYFHTIKKPIDEDLLSRVEIETQITEEEYEEYLTGQLGITIHKTRYQFYDENDVYTAVDVFSEKLEGLIYAEVEFDSVKESEDFVPPAWFGADVTSESLYKNADLSQLDDRYGIYGWYIEDGQIWIPILTPDKPVIYLYPTEQTDVSVKLDYKGVLDFTYPSIFDGGWEVTANPDGTLINKRDGREYSYLFWEGHGQASYDLSKGFVVKGEDTEEFLQEKLAYMGLLPKEYNEFIVYWLPQMQNNAYNFITFQGKEYTDTAALTVTPEPDSMLRVFMTFQGLDKPIEVPEQTLTPFTRQGFAVVEWGGCELK